MQLNVVFDASDSGKRGINSKIARHYVDLLASCQAVVRSRQLMGDRIFPPDALHMEGGSAIPRLGGGVTVSRRSLYHLIQSTIGSRSFKGGLCVYRAVMPND